MKVLILALLWVASANATKFFIEPGVFMSMYDNSYVRFEDDDGGESGHLRNTDLSYAIKIGLHSGRYEFGIETELYDYEAHLEGENGDEVRNIHITYNSVFIGYEFLKDQFIYGAIALEPYLSADNVSYHEYKPILSFEYANHLKEWVSLNVKLETESEFERPSGKNGEAVRVGTMVLVGFSFPLIQN